MKMHKLLVVLLVSVAGAGAGAGCFGSDPNMNSILVNPPDGGSATGAGGTSSMGTGGTGPSVTGPIVGGAIATFNTANEGFQLNTYADPNATNLNDPSKGANPMLTFDTAEGSPSPGALKVVAPYTGANQYVDIQKNMMTMPQDWTGRTMHVRIKVLEGDFGGGAQVYAITIPGRYVFGGTFTNIAKNNNWQEFTVNIDAPMTANAGYDPKQVIIFGVQLSSGSMGGTGTVTFLLDSLSLDPPLGGTTGTAGTGGGTGGTGAGGTTGAGGATGAAGSSADASAGG